MPEKISATKRIAKNFSWLLVGNSFNGLLIFFISIYVARALGAAAFGWLNFAQALLLYLVLLVDSGLSIFGTREISQNKGQAETLTLNILIIRLALAVVLYLASAVIVLLLPITIELKLLLGLTFLFVFYRALNTDWVFQAFEEMGFISLGKLAFTLSSLSLIVMTVHQAADLIKVPLINAVCGLLVAVVFLFILFKRYHLKSWPNLRPNLWGSYLVQALPLGASLLMIQIYGNLDTIMLGFMDRPEVVGFYNAAYKVYFVLVGVFVIWHTTAMPTINQRFKENINQAINFVNKFSRLTLLAFTPLCLLVFLWSPIIIRLVFGQSYADASLVLQVLIWIYLPVLIGSCYGVMWLVPAGKFNDFFYASLLGAVVNIVLNFILIPSYSMYGAAMATLGAEIAALSLAVYLANKVAPLNLFKFFLLPAGFSILALIPFLILQFTPNQLDQVTRYGLGGFAYLVVYLCLMLICERQFIWAFVREVLGPKESIHAK